MIEKITEMLYYILQVPEGDLSSEAVPDLPPRISQNARKSLNEEQNKAVELAARLAGQLGAAASGDGTDAGAQATQSMSLRSAEENENLEAARDRMRKKVRTIARMARMFKTLRQENETIVRLKGVCPGHKLAPGMLLAGKERLTTELEHFESATGLDLENEKRPEGADKSKRKTEDRFDFVNDDEEEEAAAGQEQNAYTSGGEAPAAVEATPPSITATMS